MTFHYVPAGPIATAFQFSNTVIPQVMMLWEFWGILGFHIGMSYLYFTGLIPEGDDGNWIEQVFSLSWNDSKVIAAITTFFQVFYTNTCYQRYLMLYDDSREVNSQIIRICMHLRLYLAKKHPRHCRLCCRYLLSTIYHFYAHINYEQVRDKRLSNGAVLEHVLVTPDEMSYLCLFDESYRFLISLHWSAKIFRLGATKGEVPANIQKGVVDKMMVIFQKMQLIKDTLELPVPFGYYHLLNLMVLVNLMLWAYQMALSESVLATGVFFFAELIFLGMMQLANQLAQPFGGKEVDFPVNAWLSQVFESAEVMLDAPEDEDNQEAWEDILNREKNISFGSITATQRAGVSGKRPWGYYEAPQSSVAKAGSPLDSARQTGRETSRSEDIPFLNSRGQPSQM